MSDLPREEALALLKELSYDLGEHDLESCTRPHEMPDGDWLVQVATTDPDQVFVDLVFYDVDENGRVGSAVVYMATSSNLDHELDADTTAVQG